MLLVLGGCEEQPLKENDLGRGRDERGARGEKSCQGERPGHGRRRAARRDRAVQHGTAQHSSRGRDKNRGAAEQGVKRHARLYIGKEGKEFVFLRTGAMKGDTRTCTRTQKRTDIVVDTRKHTKSV